MQNTSYYNLKKIMQAKFPIVLKYEKLDDI
jgi:hypothetical protein